ncbi:S-adenosyl-L-methionine-dependent methyltransferase [Xylariaceae sp. FL0255]|nr:S-adenosyl-L-methionine-dependent methyltransferase [Xylariaceae sp. FL0255]
MANTSIGEVNREFFNQHAQTIYNQDWAKKITAQLQEFLKSNVDWIGISKPSSSVPKSSPGAKLLDYACGFGVMSTTLSEHFDVIRGIDVSENMVNSYNEAAKKAGLPIERMSATRGDVLDDDAATNGTPLIDQEFFEFDAVIMSMALHHVGNQAEMLKRLVQRLKVGGVIVIIDFARLPGEGNVAFHKHGHHHDEHHHGHHGDHHPSNLNFDSSPTVSRNSFSKEDMLQFFQAAGCDGDSFGFHIHPEYTIVPEEVSGVKGRLKRKLFMAKARKTSTS